MKKFKEFIVEFDSPQIYCDMDGVLADFQKFTTEHLGHKFKDEYWHELPNDLSSAVEDNIKAGVSAFVKTISLVLNNA